ncbi:MAG TPA: alanine--tRNA ligase-related protein, partial [Candidatus Omnitrophota bacterium]|nr:alanine--tRNA ligase-related protein [Candidatus Omnitrophota bacterium]
DIVAHAGGKNPLANKIVPAVVEAMREPYPELLSKSKDISGTIKNIETSYLRVRKERIPELKEQVLKTRTLPDGQQSPALGKIMFAYRDTYGLTVSTILSVITEANIPGTVVKDAKTEFNKLMEAQQKQSRASSKMTGDVFTDTGLELNVPKTEFIGHERSRSMSTILKLYIDNQKINEITAGDHVKIILDRTPFYAEAGGQVGDTGFITADQNRIRVTDTQKIDDIFLHFGIVEKGAFKINNQVTAEIDLERRLSVMRHHTATHLLQAALRSVLGTHVQQQGSLVCEDHFRFDFTHHRAITPEEIERIEQDVNIRIVNCDTVTKDILPIEQARKSGALAFFAEKYGKVVRVVSISDYSKEFCGGTHLDSTGQIGMFKIISETAIAQGIRRLEAKTGLWALKYITENNRQLAKISQVLKTPTEKIVERLDTQAKRLKQLEKEVEQFRFEAIKNSLDGILQEAESLDGTMIIGHAFKEATIELLRKVSDLLRQKAKSSVILLGASTEGSAFILLAVTEDLVKKGLKANELIAEIAPLINGSGGGRPELAQAGSKDADKVEGAVQQANKLIKEKIKSCRS